MLYTYKNQIYEYTYVSYRNIELWIFSVYFQITLQNFYEAKNIEKSKERLKSNRNRRGFLTLKVRTECSTYV